MKKIRHFMPLIFIVLSATSIHAMLLRAFRRAPANPKQTIRKSPQSGAFYSTAKPATTASSNQAALLKSPAANSSWKDKLVNLYKTYAPRFFQPKVTALPIASVPIVPLQQPKIVQASMATAINAPIAPVKTQAQIESDEIIARLRGKNPWDYPQGVMTNTSIAAESTLAKKIEIFFLKNNVHEIENVFSEFVAKGHFNIFEILRIMCRKHPELALKFIALIEKNSNKIDDVHFIGTVLLLTSPEQLIQAEALIERFFRMTNYYLLVMYYKPEHIAKLLPKNRASLIRIIATICNKLSLFKADTQEAQSRYDQLLLFLADILGKQIINFTQEDSKILVEQIWKTGPGVYLIDKLSLQNSQLKDCMIEAIKKLIITPDEFKRLLKLFDGQLFVEAVFGLGPDYAQTPSNLYVIKYYKNLQNLYYDDFNESYLLGKIVSPIFKNMVQNITKKEKQLIKDGFDVYYHATRWPNNLLADIYMMLYEYKSGKKLTDFRFLHFDDPVLPGQGSKLFFESEEKVRKELIEKGTLMPYETTLQNVLGIGRRTLFLAKYACGNLNLRGCCPMYLMLHNFNWGNEGISIEEIFSMFGYSDIYKKHESGLMELEKKHQRLTAAGEIIQIAVPKKNISECIYNAEVGHHGQKIKSHIADKGITDDINIISDYMNKNAVENMEFILTMTRDELGGLNPDSGIQMNSYNLVDSEKMAKFKKEEEKPLFDALIESLNQYDKEKKEKELQVKKAVLAAE